MLHVKNKFDAGRDSIHVLASRTAAPCKSKMEFRKWDLDTAVYKDYIHRFRNAKIPLNFNRAQRKPSSCLCELLREHALKRLCHFLVQFGKRLFGGCTYRTERFEYFLLPFPKRRNELLTRIGNYSIVHDARKDNVVGKTRATKRAFWDDIDRIEQIGNERNAMFLISIPERIPIGHLDRRVKDLRQGKCYIDHLRDGLLCL